MIKMTYAGLEFVIVILRTAEDNDFAGTQFKDPVTGQDLVISFADDAIFFNEDYEEEEVIEHPSLTYFAVRESAKSCIATAMHQMFESTPELSREVTNIIAAAKCDEREEVRRGINDAIADIKRALTLI